ncbi:hypothetical protein CPB86DRAFT_818295 [Serendipita vermifera]|nr:hypothetical protein CPB86DRAFT_818295 [Serendipita vermifera]
MSDDEYDFTEDGFDASDFAKIDEIENKFLTTASQVPPPAPTTNLPVRPPQERFIRAPPAKRQRPNNWSAVSVPHREVEDEDDTPDFTIVAAKDGKYRIVDPSDANLRTTSLGAPIAAPSRMVASIKDGTQSSQPFLIRTPSHSSTRTNGDRHIGSSQSRMAAITAGLEDTKIGGVNEELERLRAQVAQLQQVNETTKAALKAAEEAKISKEGEVSTMRRNIAKMSVSHAETLARVQAEKDAAEEKRKQSEKQTKQELERIQTSYALRRQELETSTRRPLWSARKQGLPAPTPSRASMGPRVPVEETPSRPSRSTANVSTFRQKASAPTAYKKSQEKPKTTNAFPSFVDSFENSSPVKSPSKTQRRLAEKSKKPNMEEMFPPISHANMHALQQGLSQATGLSQSVESVGGLKLHPTETEWNGTSLDEPSSLEVDQTFGESMEEFSVAANLLDVDEEPLDVTDPRDYCIDLLFSHICRPSYQLTLQVLFSAQLPLERPEASQKFIEGSSCLLEATRSRHSEYGLLLESILNSLLCMGKVLADVDVALPLGALLNLLATMCLFLSSSTDILLRGPEDEIPLILTIILTIIQTRMKGSLQYTEADTVLVQECLYAIESLCLTASSGSSQKMRHLVSHPSFVSNILDDRQPEWVTTSIVGSLCHIAMYHDNCTYLLNVSTPVHENTRRKEDKTRLPIIEKLSCMLIENKVIKRPREGVKLQTSIVTCLTQVALSSSDALVILGHSQSLIPGLVASLCRSADIIWGEVDDVVLDDDMILSFSRVIRGILQLLHYIIFKDQAGMNLQRKLQYPPSKFNGLEHMFVVGLGRLSYADPPETQNKEAKELAESNAELARDLLEHVVDGQEVDVIWGTYQDDANSQDHDPMDDDEAIEAQNSLHADEEMDF